MEYPKTARGLEELELRVGETEKKVRLPLDLTVQDPSTAPCDFLTGKVGHIGTESTCNSASD
jgi:hypothetical protein